VSSCLVHPRRLLRFTSRVVVRFLRNRGLLLASGVGYNALLSAVPFFAITVTALSFIFDEHKILETVRAQLKLLVPNHAEAIVDAISTFLRSRDIIGVVGILVLIFFSSIAFRMLEEALEGIFQSTRKRRRLWVSALLPYVWVLFLGVSLFLVTVIRAGLDALGSHSFVVMGNSLSLAWTAKAAIQLTGFISMVILFTIIYKAIPVAPVSLRRALIGGFTAAGLWEFLGKALAYYFANISLVNIVYGSFATVIVILLSMEAASVILLLGAQVIAELERSAAAGLPWYEEGDRLPPLPPPGP
jgi:YihY family inner membrane protein